MSKLDYLSPEKLTAAKIQFFTERYDQAEDRNRDLIAKINQKRSVLNGRRYVAGDLRVDDLARLENCNRRLLAALEAIES